MSAVFPHPPRALRSDGAEARERLLHAALRLFAEHGFARTSTREIAEAAAVNIGSISYYFGDKAGLYRAAFFEPAQAGGHDPKGDMARLAEPGLSLSDAFGLMFAGFLEPLKQGELVQQCMRLHFREMIEPTGLWAEEIDSEIKPYQAAMTALLCRHFGLDAPDDDLHRLGFSIVGLAVQLVVGRDVIHAITPHLIDRPAQIDMWARRLVDYALAMVAVEEKRRAAGTPMKGLA